MTGEIVDITKALEQRQYKVKEERLQNMREAFRAARMDAKPAAKLKAARVGSAKRKKKSKKPSR